MSLKDINYVLFFIALFFLFFGLINSKILTPFNILWIRFGLILGKLFSPVIMGIIYFFVITPTSLFLKLFKKDILQLKKNNQKSYWTKRKNLKTSMRDQF